MDLYSLFSILSDAERAQIMAMLDNATHQKAEAIKRKKAETGKGFVETLEIYFDGFALDEHIEDLSEFSKQIGTPSRFSIPEPEDYKEPGQ